MLNRGIIDDAEYVGMDWLGRYHRESSFADDIGEHTFCVMVIWIWDAGRILG